MCLCTCFFCVTHGKKITGKWIHCPEGSLVCTHTCYVRRLQMKVRSKCEHSHRADSSSTAEAISCRDNINVCPQRAAGATRVNFTAFPGLLWTTEDVAVVEYILPCINKANISFFNLGQAHPVHYSQICKSTATNPDCLPCNRSIVTLL